MAVLQPGTKLKHGTFEIVSLLGSGGFGEVYLGRQARVERDVAIKVLHPHIGADADMVVRFQREAFAAANLAHPHVLTVFDFDYDENAGAWFLAMQYVPGGRTLRDVLGPPRSVAETVYLIEGIAGALDAAHARGIVHRDVKPENVMLDGNRALLTDFGIAHLSEMSSMTAVGLTIGTPAYMSPEQAMGQTIGARSDQYALAVMVYEMLAGRLPFLGESIAMMIQHASGEPPPLETFNPEIVPSARGAVARAMSKNPEDRFSSCMAFVDVLRMAVMQSASRRSAAPPAAPAAEPDRPVAASAPSPVPPASALSADPPAAAAPSSVPPQPAAPDPQIIPPADRTVVRPRAASAAPPSAEEIPEAGRTVVRASGASPAPPAPTERPGMPREDLSPEADDVPPAARTVLRPSASEAEVGAPAPDADVPPDATRLRPSAVDRAASQSLDPSQATVPRASRPPGPPEPYLQPSAPVAPISDSAAASAAALADVPSPDRSQGAPAPEAAGTSPPTPAPPASPRHPPPVTAGGVRRGQPVLIGASVAVLVGLIALVVVGRALFGPRNESGTAGQAPPIVQSSPGVPPREPPVAVAPDPTAAPGMGTVRVASFPDGASIMVNGEPAGRAPRAISLNPGEYTLTLVSPSYDDWTQQVRVIAAQQMTVEANLAPLNALKALEIGQTRMGRDAYLDPGGTIRLGTVADTFTLADEVNAIVYLKPSSFRIRDLSFQATTRWQRAGDATPLVLQAEQQVSRDWEETFVRACAPAAAIDPRGSNTPLRVEILIDGEVVAQFSYRIVPGNPAATSSNPCDANALPSRMAALVRSRG